MTSLEWLVSFLSIKDTWLMMLWIHNSNIKENKAGLVLEKASYFCKGVNSNMQERNNNLKEKRRSCLRNKIMNSGRLRIQHWLKLYIKWEIILKKLNNICYLIKHKQYKNFWMSVNILNNSFLMKQDAQLCSIIWQVKIVLLMSVNNITIIWVKILMNGPISLTFTVI